MIHTSFVQLSKNWYVRLATATMQDRQNQKQLNYCVNASLRSKLKPQYAALMFYAALYHGDSIDSVDRRYLAVDHQRITDPIRRQSVVALGFQIH
jgi:hypothetical protein